MTHPEPYSDSSLELRPLSRVLDDDVLDLIVGAYVNGDVQNALAETPVATIERQRRCRRLQTVSWQFATIVQRHLYVHVHFPTAESLSKFCKNLEDERSPDFKAKVEAYTRCVSFGFAFDPYQSQRDGEQPIFSQVETVLKASGKRLRGFRQLGDYLSPLPSKIWKALRTHCLNIEYLDGFTLEQVSWSTDAFIQQIVSFRHVKRITTTIVWLPPSFVPEVRRRMLLTEEEKRRSGLLVRNCRKRFAHLESLRTPLLRWDNLLVEALMIADLPKLHTLQLGVWDSDSVARFLEKHGPKLLHVDLLLCRWSEWPNSTPIPRESILRHTQERFQIEHIFRYCPSLRVFTIHQPESLRKLVERAGLVQGTPRLETIRLGSSDQSSYSSTVEFQPFDEISFPFKNMSDLHATQQALFAADWKRMFPHLREIEVYLPAFMLNINLDEVECGRRWRGMLVGKVCEEEDFVPREEARYRILEWREVLERQGVTLVLRQSPTEAQWNRPSITHG